MVGSAFNLWAFFSLMVASHHVKKAMQMFNEDSDDDFEDTLMKNVKLT